MEDTPSIGVTQGSGDEEVSRILLLTENAIRQWVSRYESQGLESLQNHPDWGGEHGQRCLNTEQLADRRSRHWPGKGTHTGWPASVPNSPRGGESDSSNCEHVPPPTDAP
jgi:hypothetical protein